MINFSILMSIYVREDPKLFDQCLKSIKKQSILPDEIILVEDGPITKELKNVIKKYKKNLPIKNYSFKKNKGLALALNYGLSKCKNEFIIRADSDDINLPGRFEKLLDCLKSGYDLVGSQIREFDDYGLKDFRTVPLKQEDIIRFARFRNPFNHMSVAYRKSAVKKAGMYLDHKFKEDYFLWINMIKKNNKVKNISDVLVKAFSNYNSIKRRGGLSYAISEIKLYKELFSAGICNFFEAIFIGLARVIIFSSPYIFRHIFYKLFLRKRL